MSSSTDPLVQEAVNRLDDIHVSNASYDALIVAASPSARLDKLDDTLVELHRDPGVMAEVVHLDIVLH